MLCGPLAARTITLTAEDCDQMAFVSDKVPRLSWAGMQVATAAYNSEPSVQLFPGMAILIRFPLDKIPKGQRITKAELTAPADYVAGTPQVSVRRLLVDWGHGACHLYRQTYPKKLAWDTPGARGASTDRAAKDTAVFRFEKSGDHTVDVTEDVELWYTGATANRGWVLMIENNSGPVYMPSPYGAHFGTPKRWKLQITFEPR
jgi:hypothetical protein